MTLISIALRFSEEDDRTGRFDAIPAFTRHLRDGCVRQKKPACKPSCAPLPLLPADRFIEIRPLSATRLSKPETAVAVPIKCFP